MKPWTDRSGRFSSLKLATLIAVLAPGVWIAGQLASGRLGPLPIEGLMDGTGRWAIRFLLLSLLVTPMQRVGNWPRLILVRRMIGIAALGYAMVHLTAYVLNQSFDVLRVASEISLRAYLTTGFVAIAGLIILGATSTDRMVRLLGQKWRTLHRMAYAIAMLGIAHFFLQAKIDATEPTLMAGFFMLLMAYRVVIARRMRLSPLTVLGTGLIASLGTAGLEFAWYALATGVNPWAVLQANFALPAMLRPAALVFCASLVLTFISVARSLVISRSIFSAGRLFARA
jgi:sulfoxide reductase heme-binding subunit YedZ